MTFPFALFVGPRVSVVVILSLAGSIRPATTFALHNGPEESIESRSNQSCGDAWVTRELRDDPRRSPSLSESGEEGAHSGGGET